jgi:choline dehydrogenase-like flavoprotein
MEVLVEGNDVSGDVDCDICVVGAGAAGIAIAMQLRGARPAVALIESGGLEREAGTQALYQGTQSGIPTDKLHLNRLRYLGGTTGHWGGWCRPLDAIDFERRPWVPHSGWPFGREELDRFYPLAHRLCEIDAPSYDPAHWTTAEARARGVLLPGELLRNIVFHVSDPPTRFGARYRGELEAAPNITTYLHSNVIDIETDAGARHVTGLHVATLAGARFRARARLYVLAAGAVENARLLLSSDAVQPAGLGNGHDLVGRFFAQHPCVRKTRCVTFAGDILGRFARRGSRDDVRIASGVSEQVSRASRILNSHFLLLPDRTRERGVLRALYERFAGRTGGDEIEEAIADLLGEFGEAPEDDGHARRFFTIEERAEQAPNPNSRVTLGAERDALGMRRIDMDWRLGDLDLITLRTTREILIREFGASGLGRLRDWPEGYNPIEQSDEPLSGGHHHFGTTRMHDDPRQGVVDADCRVHGIDNLYVAGSSVFPTTGYANPTLTIVALALRLSETIAARLA